MMMIVYGAYIISFRLRLRIHKEIELNNHKEMERNKIYLSKGNEWKKMK